MNFDQNDIILRVADVVKLYRNLKLSDTLIAVRWLMEAIKVKLSFQNGLLDSLRVVYENTFIKYKNKIVQLHKVVATGWKVSVNIANITLLHVEWKSRNSWKYNLFSAHFDIDTITNYVLLASESRYIDDIFEIWTVNKNKLTSQQIILIKNILQSDNGLRYNELESNIKLKCEVTNHVVYLDMKITYHPFLRLIVTSIHVKDGKLNTFLHCNSNNSEDQFASIPSGEKFRSVVINDNELDHQIFIYALICKFRERGWHQALIRKRMKRCKLNYIQRLSIIKKSAQKMIKKQHLNIMEILDRLNGDILSNEEYIYWCNIIAKEEEEKGEIIRFKKIYNRFIGNDELLRSMFHDLLYDLETDGVRIQISNCVNVKLSRLLF